MSLDADLRDFVHDHRPHGPLTADATEPAWNGYLLKVACQCGVVFQRWVTPAEAGLELAHFSVRPTCSRGRVRLACPRPSHSESKGGSWPGVQSPRSLKPSCPPITR